MVRRAAEVTAAANTNMRGGEGTVYIHKILDGAAEMQERGRLFSRIVLEPGCSIGYHRHEGEMEAFYCVRGSCAYDDNGTKTRLEAGDISLTNPGEGHSVKNDGDETAELIALILFAREG